MSKDKVRNNKFVLVSILLSLIGIGLSVYQTNQSNFNLWLIYFGFCIGDLGWNTHDNKIKKLEDKITELECKLK